MKIRNILFGFLSLLVSLPVIAYHDRIDLAVISEYQKHDPLIVVLCGEEKTEGRFYEDQIWNQIPYQAVKFYIDPENTLFAFEVPSEGEYERFYNITSDNEYRKITPESFQTILEEASPQAYRFFVGKPNECSRGYWV